MPSIDLSLFNRPLEIAEDENEGMEGKSFAVYTMIPATTAELEQICEKCDEEVDEDIKQTRPAPVIPKVRFVGRPLSEVVDFHRRLIRGDASWDKSYFVMVTRNDWADKGVFVVTLSSNGSYTPDGFYMPTKEVGSNLINLQIGNTDWIETRYGYESYHLARAVEDNREHNYEGKIDNNAHAHQDPSQPDNQLREQLPCFAIYNAVYPPRSAQTILDNLDPEWHRRYNTGKERFFEGQIPWERPYKTRDGQIDTVWCSDPWSEAIARHPAQCKQSARSSWRGRVVVRSINTRNFLYCDETFDADKTVVLVKMIWDEDLSSDDDEIWEAVYGDEVTVEKEICGATDAYEKLVALSNGTVQWSGTAVDFSRDHPVKPDDFGQWA